MIPHGTTFEFEYLGKFEIEIKNILEHESGAHMGLIHEKNQRPKISCSCTFNLDSRLDPVEEQRIYTWVAQQLDAAAQVGSLPAFYNYSGTKYKR